MGLLDMNFDDPATMGLLSAGLNMIGNSGRGSNMGTAQILAQGLGSGIEGYQGTKSNKRLLAKADLDAQMEQMRLNTGNLNLQQLQDSATRNKSIQEAIMKGNAAQNTPDASPKMQESPLMSSSYQPDVGSQLPAWLKPQAQTGQQQSNPSLPAQIAPTSSNMNAKQISELHRQADIYEQFGDSARADALRDRAIKLQPEYDSKPQVGVDQATGKQFTYLVDKQGNTKRLSDTLPRDELHFDSSGGQLVGLDKFTGKPVSSMEKTQTKDSLASQATIRRGQDLAHQDTPIDPSQTEAMAQMIASNRSPGLSKYALTTPQGMAIMSRVNQINPSYSSNDLSTMGKAEKDFATGKQGNSVRSFNVALSHLDTLDQLSDALKNKDTQLFNKIGNAYATQTGNSAPTNFEAAKKIVADEVVKSIVGSGGGVADREEAAKTISAASSPEQLKGVIKTYKELMKGQLVGLGDQYKATTGKGDFETKYLSDAARKVTAHSQQPQKTIVKTGMYGGKKVVQYSDGTTDYAN